MTAMMTMNPLDLLLEVVHFLLITLNVIYFVGLVTNDEDNKILAT